MGSPVVGLTPTKTHPAGPFNAYAANERSQPVIFRAPGVLIPSTDASSLLIEMGATGSGMGVWYQAGLIKARCGAGGGSTSNTDHAYGETTVVKGSTVDITVEFDPANKRLRLWIGEELRANAVSSQAWTDWAGGDNAGYGSTNSSTAFNVTTSTWPSTLQYPLEAYINQRSNWVEGGGATPPASTSGTGSGSFTTTGTGSGKAPAKGTGSGSFGTTGTGQGQVVTPEPDATSGTGQGSFDTTGTGQGDTDIKGQGQGGFVSSGSGQGAVADPGGASGGGSFETDAEGAGKVRVSGTGQGGFSTDAQGAGKTKASGQGSGEFTTDSEGTGTSTVTGQGTGSFTTAADGRIKIFEPAGPPPASRIFTPPRESRLRQANNMHNWPNKDPDDVLDYAVDWSEALDGDTIDTHQWIVPEGINLDRQEMQGNIAIAWLSGGEERKSYRITSRLFTAAGRQIDRTAMVHVVSR